MHRADPPPAATIAILGSGSLAAELCQSLADTAAVPVRVAVIARSTPAAERICLTANMRAVTAGIPARFAPVTSRLTGSEPLADLFTQLRPDGVVICASTQSPWERFVRPSGWTDLLTAGGFALTVAFNTEVALAAAAAAHAAVPQAWLVNACFPDAVNPLLAALDAPVLTGFGNVATVATALAASLELRDQSRLQTLAHHYHLSAPARLDDEALAWADGEPVPDIPKHLDGLRTPDRRHLNRVAGLHGATLVNAIITATGLDTHLPGPNGLAGGYPVRVQGTNVSLRLPPTISRTAAIELNRRWTALDGLSLSNGRIRFSAAAATQLTRYGPEVSDGFALTDLRAVTSYFHDLRHRLRSQPSVTR